jgi:hypothetical protein
MTQYVVIRQDPPIPWDTTISIPRAEDAFRRVKPIYERYPLTQLFLDRLRHGLQMRRLGPACRGKAGFPWECCDPHRELLQTEHDIRAREQAFGDLPHPRFGTAHAGSPTWWQLHKFDFPAVEELVFTDSAAIGPGTHYVSQQVTMSLVQRYVSGNQGHGELRQYYLELYHEFLQYHRWLQTGALEQELSGNLAHLTSWAIELTDTEPRDLVYGLTPSLEVLTDQWWLERELPWNRAYTVVLP